MSKAIILTYHNIAVPPPGARIPNLYVSPRMFRFQMGYLKAAGFSVLPLQELLALVSGGTVGRNIAAVTFDDGYQDFYTNAFPILRHYGYPATVYAVSGCIGKANVWDAAEEPVSKPLMGWQELREIGKGGIQIGSHSRSHPQLTQVSDAVLRDELEGARQDLEQGIGCSIDHFCYPYGDHDDRVRAAVIKAGYRSATVTVRGHVEQGYDPYRLRRIPIKFITNPLAFFYKIHTDSEKRKGLRSLKKG